MMTSTAANFFKGVTAGLVIGAGVTMLMDPITDRQRRRLVRKTEGVFKSVGGAIDTAIDMFR